MKKNLTFLWGGVLLFAVASCSVDSATPVPSDPRVRMEFTAGTPGTRTAINSDNSVSWTDDDAISVFDGTYNNEFTISSGAGSSNATFSGAAIESDTYYALYPYSADAALSGSTISSVLPSDQLSGYNTFSPGTNPSVAVSEGNTLVFHNVAGLVRVTLPEGYSGERTVSEIQLSADQSLSGAYTVDMSGSSYSAVATAKTPAGVRLIPSDSNSGVISGTEFYLAVLPGSYTNLKLSVIFTDGSYMTGTIASAEITAGTVFNAPVDPDNATANDQGLYGLYQAGIDIEIGGKYYNIADFGEAQLIVSDSDLSALRGNNSGVYFIDPDATVTFSYAGAIYKLLLIGNDPDRMSNIIPTQNFKANSSGNNDAELLLYNINLDFSAQSAYLIAQNNITPSAVRIIGCRLNLPKAFTYISTDGRSFTMIDLQDNVIKLSDSESHFMNFASNTATFPYINISNNIFYGSALRFITGNSATIDKLAFTNNTIVDAFSNDGWFYYGTLNEVIIRNNLIYRTSQSGNLYIFRPSNTEAGAGEPYPGNPRQGTCEQSIVYDAAQSEYNRQWFYYGMQRVVLTEEQEMTSLTENPFSELDIATETFTVKPEYASYGAQR